MVSACVFARHYVSWKGINGYAKLYAISSKFTSWSSLTVPTNVDDFTLAVYHSQLVLIGGIVLSESSFEVQSDLWVYDGSIWQRTLPPMLTGCYAASALNTGPPEEYLVVAGGINREGKKTTAVEVLVENQWSSIQPQCVTHSYLFTMGTCI